MNRKYLSLLLIATLSMGLLTGCMEAESSNENLPITVQTTTASTGEFSLYGTYLATIEPYNQTAVMPMLQGEVSEISVAIGEQVKEGDVLMTVDTENAQDQYETATDAVNRASESYGNIYESTVVKAPISGYVRDIDTELLATVAPTSQLAYVSNDNEMEIKIPFLTNDIANISIGETALVSLSDTGEVLNGMVKEISGAPEFIYGNIQVNYVTISVQNPGGVQAGREATATIGAFACSDVGKFESSGSSPVISGLSGTVEEIFVQNGDYVTVGQPMFRVLNPSIKTQLTNAGNSISDAQDRQEDASEYLSDHAVKAPISGTVSSIAVEEFDMISTNSVVMEIVSEDSNYVTFSVSEKTIPHIKVGETFTVEVSGNELNGTVTEVSTVANSKTGLFTVKGQIEQNGVKLYSGTTAEVTIANFTDENALVIPFDAVQYQGEEAYVYIYNDGVAEKRIIEVSNFDNDEIIVTDGIEKNEKIITTWSSGLRANALVTEENSDVSN